MITSPILIGLAAGTVSAILFVSLYAANTLAALLFHLAPLPLLLAGFGWGTTAARVALLVGTALTAVLLYPEYKLAVLFVIMVGLPSVILTWLASLNRPVPADPAPDAQAGTPGIEWYPLGRLIAWAAVIGGCVAALRIWMVDEPEKIEEAIKSVPALQAFLQSNDPTQTARLVELIRHFLLPASAGFSWLLITTVNIWIAAKSVQVSGQLRRPWPDLVELTYPPQMLVVFLASIVLGMIPGYVGTLAMGLVGAFLFAFMMMGLTVIHALIPDSALKPIILAGVYMAVLLLGGIVIPLVALLGISEPFFQFRRRTAGQSTPPHNDAGPNT